MIETAKTVAIKPFVGYPALWMTWQQEVNSDDIEVVFKQAAEMLNESDTSLYIIVDLRNNPQLPIVDTFMAALRGPFRSPRLREWLVIDTNSSARWIESLLKKASRRENIRWFNTEEKMLSYLDSMTDNSEGLRS